MRRWLIAGVLSAGALGGCTNVPDLESSVSDTARRAGYPVLIDLTGLLTNVGSADDATRAARTLAARAAALRARARSLQRPIVDDHTRRRMAAALRRHQT